MIKYHKILTISLMLMMSMGLFAAPSLQLGVGPGHQALRDLNTSSLVWTATGPAASASFSTAMRSGLRYQLELSIASVNFKGNDANYFSLSSSMMIGMLTRFLKPIPLGSSVTFLAGAGFSSPILSIRHSNLWSMTTAMEASVDLTANAGMEIKMSKWEASLIMDLPVASLAMVQDYNASGNHVMRFASLHNSFQLFTRLGCLYSIGESVQLGLEAAYAQRYFKLIKEVDSRVYGLNLVCRFKW